MPALKFLSKVSPNVPLVEELQNNRHPALKMPSNIKSNKELLPDLEYLEVNEKASLFHPSMPSPIKSCPTESFSDACGIKCLFNIPQENDEIVINVIENSSDISDSDDSSNALQKLTAKNLARFDRKSGPNKCNCSKRIIDSMKKVDFEMRRKEKQEKEDIIFDSSMSYTLIGEIGIDQHSTVNQITQIYNLKRDLIISMNRLSRVLNQENKSLTQDSKKNYKEG